MKLLQSIQGFMYGIVALCLLLMSSNAGAQQQPDTSDPKVAAAMKDMQAAQQEVIPLLIGKEFYGDEKTRTDLAQKVLPGLHKMQSAIDILTQSQKGAPKSYNVELLGLLAYFGDADAAAKLKKDAQSTDEVDSVGAQSSLILGDWWTSARDAAAQKKVLERTQTLAKAHPKADQIVQAIMMMRDSAASEELRAAALNIVTDDLKGPAAMQVGPQIAAEKKMHEMIGKPFVVSGIAVDGSKFTSADWKGKVVMVDFWATWCGPCMAELPNVKKAYADYHAKGLEIIGVSCDNGAEPLQQFLKKNPDMPWPQLFDAANPGWHEVAKSAGVQGIPTMFLIDRAGNLRTTEARGNLETEITKLLDEKPPAK